MERINKLGFELKLASNFPWMYIIEINGKKVTEKFNSDHGFVLGFQPITPDREFSFSDIHEIFKLLKEYR